MDRLKNQRQSQNNILSDASDLYKDTKDIHSKIKGIFDELIDERDSETTKYTSGVTQWSVKGRQFSPSGQTSKSLPAGWYKFTWNGYMSVPEMMDIRNDELIRLPMPEYDSVLADMKMFWESEENFRKFRFPYKRGILLYGRPGTGKSGLVRLVCDELIKKHDGVIFNVDESSLGTFEVIFSLLREIDPKRKVICVLEDVDNISRYGGSSTARLLNILDGNLRFDNILFLATTNFPQALLESISNRPSRFDRRYEVGTPSPEARKVYISTKFKELSEEEVDKVVKLTNGFTIDALKELVLSVYVMGYDLTDTVNELERLFTYSGKVGDDLSRFKGDSKEKMSLRDSFDNDLIR